MFYFSRNSIYQYIFIKFSLKFPLPRKCGLNCKKQMDSAYQIAKQKSLCVVLIVVSFEVKDRLSQNNIINKYFMATVT